MSSERETIMVMFIIFIVLLIALAYVESSCGFDSRDGIDSTEWWRWARRPDASFEQVVLRSDGAQFLHTQDQTETYDVAVGQIDVYGRDEAGNKYGITLEPGMSVDIPSRVSQGFKSLVDSTFLAGLIPAGKLEALLAVRSQQHVKVERTARPQEIFSLESSIEGDDSRFPLLLSVSFPPDLDGDAMKRIFMNTNLAKGTLHLINLCIDRDIDTIYFLDKSARPPAFLFRHTWQRLMPDVPLPHIRYINIGLSQDEMIEAYNHTVEQALQARFALTKPKHLLIADEYTDTGSSLRRAETVLRTVFPQAESITTTGIFERKIVSWYSGASTSGYSQEALLGIRDKPGQNLHDPLDPYFIEPMHGEKDTSLRLRSELAQMASLIAEHACRHPRGTFAVKPIAPRHPRNDTHQKSQEIRPGLKLEDSRNTSLHKIRHGVAAADGQAA